MIDMTPIYITGVTMIVIIVAIFFLCRELMCWYWKINEHLRVQTEIRDLLKKLVDQGRLKQEEGPALGATAASPKEG